MPEINYIRQLNVFFLKLGEDKRLNATHVSMYVVLFYQWNIARFSTEFYINRNEIMSLSRIGSKGTYHKCIKDLNEWKYLEYLPSYNPQIGSSIKMFKFDTPAEQVVGQVRIKKGTGSVQVSEPYININKHNRNFIKLEAIAKEKLIFEFFKKEKWPELEAKKFFNHYQGIGWKVGGKSKIVDWQATAKSWMLKAGEMSFSSKARHPEQSRGTNGDLPLDHFSDNLHVNENKRYDEPL